MTALPDAATALDVIAALDFDPEMPCEMPGHARGVWGCAGPGWALVANQTFPCCGWFREESRVVCRGFWEWAARVPCRCPRCETSIERDQALRVVRVLR